VANLSTTPQLREALLASDPAVSPASSTNDRGLVESLVHLGVKGGSSETVQPGKKEEEIGTRRECMRALVGLAKCQAVRDTVRASSVPWVSCARRGLYGSGRFRGMQTGHP